MKNVDETKRVGTWVSAVCLFAAILSAPGCATDDKFSAETYDEYTAPLTNAVIGTPTGVTTVSPEGLSTTSAATPAVTSPSANPAKGGSGAGRAAGAGGSSSGFAGSGPIGGGPSAGGEAGGGQGGGSSGNTGDSSSGSGFWHLVDSSGLGANAQQALKADCQPGISGLGVQFRTGKDIVQVPDEPQFTVGQHIGVAAWVHPNTVSGNQPIVIKRLNSDTAFSLGVHNGNIEMSVVLSTGKTIISRAPIAAGTWTHVAGMYDGTFVFLFINGQQFGQVFAAGTVRDVFAPIRIGATTQSQFFNGIIDEVFVTTQTITSDVLTSLSCVARPSTLTVTPATSGPVPFDTSVHYDVSVSNNDIGLCQPKQYDAFVSSLDPGISANFENPFQVASPGTTLDFGVDVSGSDSADPGVHEVPFFVQSFGGPPNFGFEQLPGQLTYELAQPTGCFVTTRRELMITSTSVVDDPVRTAGSSNPVGGGGGSGGSTSIGEGGADAGGSFGVAGTASASGGSFGIAGGPSKPNAAAVVPAADPANPSSGVWTFGHLMREMAPTEDQAPAFTLALFQHWLSDQTVNGFTVSARPAMQQQLLDIWPKTPDGALDLDQAPLTLQAIVNRIDVRNLAEHSAGEGRLVFGVNGNINFQQFTVIVEYNLPAQTQDDVQNWANRWHALASHPFPSEEYNAALEAITRSFTDRGASPGSVNGSALVELRTNEIALSFQWELRAFALSPTTGFLDETTVKETPDLGFNNTPQFADFVNQNADAIIAEVPGGNSHTVPLQFEGQPFMGGSVFNNLIEWGAPGIVNPEARFHASMNTCNGCHGPETNTTFLMVTPRFPGSEATLSPFLTGTTVRDQFTGEPRTINDLERRKDDLTALVCTPAAPTPVVAAPPTKATKKVAKKTAG
jgi:hypothetical protein